MKITPKAIETIDLLINVIREKPYSAESEDAVAYIEEHLECHVSFKEVIIACWKQKTLSPTLRTKK
jgi:hypothetical protein